MSDMQKIKESLTDVETIQDSMRIIIEMITDTMTQNDLASQKEMMRAQERIIVLSNHALAQLKELETVATEIWEACDA